LNFLQENQIYNNNIEKILFLESQIQKKVKGLGQQITRDFTGKDLVVIGVLKGAFVFVSDLVRNIELPLMLDFIHISSYGNATVSSGVVAIKRDIGIDIEGKDVLIVEDIVDTGLTIKKITEIFDQRKARTISVCSILDKPSRRNKDMKIKIDYIGFTISDEFVVGYGLDFKEEYRNLPDICVLKKEAYI
jgi:hypoxanthine phosphoribosyltransferase